MPRAERLSPGGVKLLEEAQIAIISTIMPDGSPQSTPVWVDVEPDGSHLLVNTVEGHLKLDPLISQAVLIGDRRPFISVLLTLDPDEAPKWAEARGIRAAGPVELASHPKVLEEVEAIVSRVNEDLSQVEKIKKWTILPHDFTQEAEEITPTLKVRRKIINEKYSSAIEQVYQ